jgi:flavin reductase (DIM6/NTAB) family NADH-FMN oxidoreductase RutF
MHHFTLSDIEEMSKIYRLNLINSVTGYKSAHLLGTISIEGNENLAIFSSVIHLGSNPAIIGFILRPTTVPRHTYENIKSTGVFTLNAIHKNQIADAHHTSAKYPKGVSEFNQTELISEKKKTQKPHLSEMPQSKWLVNTLMNTTLKKTTLYLSLEV